MDTPKVSVIIPVYNGADHVGETIQSVLDQTYSNFELFVVNDASPDNTNEVVRRFDDPRLIYIVHPENRGSDPARITGLSASTGEIVIFLDQDDLLHPEKLAAHVSYFEQNPDVGVTYNARFDLLDASNSICGLWDPPEAVSLADLVLGFPFAPSDMVLRREWALLEEIWDNSFAYQGEEVILNGGEIVFCSRLYFAGCKFGKVGRALNYRRYHSGRVLRDLPARCRSERACQEIVLNDPRCPADVKALQDIAFMNSYRIWAYFAFAQGENALGQEYVLEAVRLDPSLVDGNPCGLVSFLVNHAVGVEKLDHEALLQNFFDSLPAELNRLSVQEDWAIARGYLMKGVQAVMWDGSKEGRQYFDRAAELGAVVDEDFLEHTAFQIRVYEREFGAEAAALVVQNLAPFLDRFGEANSGRRLMGRYSANRAFEHYENGRHQEVPGQVLQAYRNDPNNLRNRGLLSILLRSTVAN